MTETTEQPDENNGCLYFIYLFFNIASLLGIIIGVRCIKDTIAYISLINDSDKIELRDFYIQSYTGKDAGGKSGGGILYIFSGTIEGKNEIFKTSVETNFELNYHTVEKMIAKQQAKIWYLEREGEDFIFLQKVRPSKRELLDYLWWSLWVMFIAPLLMLIRLLVLYKMGRLDV